MAAPAAPEVPAVAVLLAAAGAFLCYLAASGMLTAWRRSLGKLLVYFADQLDRVSVRILGRTFRIFGSLAALLRTANRNVDTLLGEAVEWSGKGASAMFSYFLTMQLWIWQQMSGLANDTYAAIKGVRTTTVNTTTKVIRQTVVKPITKQVTVVLKVSSAAVRTFNKRLSRAEKRVAALAVAVAGVAALPLPRIGRLEKRAKAAEKRLTRLEKLTLGAVGAAATLAALKRLGLGWLRCGNVTRSGKRVCGMDSSLLDSLLAGSLLLTSALSLQQMARELREPTALVMDGLDTLVSELRRVG